MLLVSLPILSQANPAPPRAVFCAPRASYAASAKPQSPQTPPATHLSLQMPPCASSSLYDVLGIPVGAKCEEIKVAYRRLARTCHPDVASVERKDACADEFMRLHAAYSTLSDPQKRAVYDSSLFRRNRANRRPLTAASRADGYRGRNWETDQCW